MKLRLKAFLCISVLILLVCCNSAHRKPEPHWFKHYSHFNEKDYEKFLENEISKNHDTADFAVVIREFYSNRNFHPFWTHNGLQEADADSLLAIFADAPAHGISPNFFQYDSIQAVISNLKNHKTPNDDNLYSKLYSLEWLFTQNMLKYACAMRFGATDPKIVHGNKWYYKTERPDSLFVTEVLSNLDNFIEELNELQPKNKDYVKLQNSFSQLVDLQKIAKDTIPKNYKTRLEKDTNLVKIIKKRLEAFGINIENAVNGDNIDDYISKFCKQNAIPATDSEDEVLSVLNHPEEYMRKVCASLERLRWKKIHKKSDDTIYILVNIPDFHYYAVQKDSIILKNRICCGRTQNPKGIPSRYRNGLVLPFKSETPLMYSNITSVTLNPEWNIPYDIIKNEYYPKLVRSNTACINKEKIYIKDSRTGRYVVPDSINWSKVSRGNIPYRLYQTSGRHNALGLVKFVFANGESVYLHDTNNKGAFKRRRRALSHGCVRVEFPRDLADWIFEVNRFDTNYMEKLHIILGDEPTTEEGEKFVEKCEEKEAEYFEGLNDYDRLFYRKLRPTSVRLKKRIPLFIDYQTCFIDENGEIQYRDDIYYKDANIWKQVYPELGF